MQARSIVTGIISGAIMVLFGCGDDVKTGGVGTLSSQPSAPPVAATAPLSSSPTWAIKAQKDDAANCYLDVVNDVNLRPGGVSVSVKKDVPLVIAGWSVDKKRLGIQGEVVLELASSDRKHVYLFMGKRSPRPDVSNNENYRDLALEMPAVSLAADTKEMTAGVYEVTFVMRRSDEDGISCSIGKAWKIEL